PFPLRRPRAPQRGEVANPQREVVDVAGHRVVAEPPRTRLPAPVGRRDAPAAAAPVFEGLEVLFVSVAPSGHEQQGAAHEALGLLPVEPADRVTVGRDPALLDRAGRHRAAVEGRGRRLGYLANSGLPPVVTFW